MARWLEKFVNKEMFDRYIGHGEDQVHGYAVDARAIRPTDTSRELFEALFLEWPVTEQTRVAGIATLRFPLWPTDRAIAAMGGTTSAEQAITKGPILEHPPFDGRGMVKLPGDPIAALSYVEPTRLRAGAQLIKHEADGSPESLIATYGGARIGWVLPEGTPLKAPPPLAPVNPFLGPQVRRRGEQTSDPADLVVSDDDALVEVCNLASGTDAAPLEPGEIAEVGFMQTRVTWKGLPCLLAGRAGQGQFRLLSLALNAYAAEERGMTRIEAGVYEAVIPGSDLPLPEMMMRTPPSWPHE